MSRTRATCRRMTLCVCEVGPTKILRRPFHSSLKVELGFVAQKLARLVNADSRLRPVQREQRLVGHNTENRRLSKLQFVAKNPFIGIVKKIMQTAEGLLRTAIELMPVI